MNAQQKFLSWVVQGNFLLCGTVLHFAPLAPTQNLTVVAPDHCDNQKKPPNFSKCPLQGVWPLWKPLIYRICSWKTSNLWFQGQAQGFVPLSTQKGTTWKWIFKEFFDTVSQHSEWLKGEKCKKNETYFNNFYMQMYIFIYTYMKSMFSLWTFLSKARCHLSEMFSTLKIFL